MSILSGNKIIRPIIVRKYEIRPIILGKPTNQKSKNVDFSNVAKMGSNNHILLKCGAKVI